VAPEPKKPAAPCCGPDQKMSSAFAWGKPTPPSSSGAAPARNVSHTPHFGITPSASLSRHAVSACSDFAHRSNRAKQLLHQRLPSIPPLHSFAFTSHTLTTIPRDRVPTNALSYTAALMQAHSGGGEGSGGKRFYGGGGRGGGGGGGAASGGSRPSKAPRQAHFDGVSFALHSADKVSVTCKFSERVSGQRADTVGFATLRLLTQTTRNVTVPYVGWLCMALDFGVCLRSTCSC